LFLSLRSEFHSFLLGQPHTKNWRPQLLILCKLNDDLMPKYRKMFAFVSQLKAGKGLTVCMSVIPGDYVKRHGAAATAKANLRKHMDDERVKGFVDVLITKNVADGLSHM
jgi:solute carrier family 12 (potassium/chloride transporter), member 4/6